MLIGSRLKKLRIKQNLSQRELARILCISQAMVARIETGTKNPSLQLCIAIAEVLNCTVSDIVGC